MMKVDMSGGSRIVNAQDGSAPKEAYQAPKLTVVGTVDDLTLGTANVGAADGPFLKTGGGG